MLISTLWLEVVEMLIDILLHRTTMGDTEELHSFTDTEYGLTRREYFSHRREEVAVIVWTDAEGSLFLLSIERWIDIGSARKDECITNLDIGCEIRRKNRDHDRETSCILDRADIVEGEIVKNPSCILTFLSKDADFLLHIYFFVLDVSIFPREMRLTHEYKFYNTYLYLIIIHSTDVLMSLRE
jgi:hypothetical protein